MTVSLELLGRGPARPDLLEDLVVAEADLAERLDRWRCPAPVAVAGEPGLGLPGLGEVAATLAAGTAAVVDVDAGLRAAQVPGAVGPAATEPGAPDPAGRLADLLVVAADAGVGFGTGLVPRCTSADDVWAVLAGAVAAMTGADVRAALAAPDPAALLGLSRSAREAVRDVVTCVVVPPGDVRRVADALGGATPPEPG